MTIATEPRVEVPRALGDVRVGDRVRVRSREAILATLDNRGRLDGLPLMPEMLACAGRVFEVDAVVHRTCDTIKTAGTSGTTRGIDRTVHLRDSRCDGSAHGGCQARCLLYWKIDWLEPAPAGVGPGEVLVDLPAGGADDDVPATVRAGTRGPGDTDDDPVWSCQATELLGATHFVSARNLRPWLDDVRSGNASARAAIVGAAVIAFNKWQAFSRRLPRPLRIRGGRSWPAVRPTGERLRPPPLGLQPGELVEIRSQREIEATLNDKAEQRGLRFAAEMVPYCGTRARVLARVERVIDEKSGRMLALRDCILLDDVWCTGDHRALCRRKIYAYWREGWLRRVGDRPEASDRPVRVAATLPTYNRRDTLREALTGLLTQSRAVDEVIVVDNASSDGSAEMVAAEFPAVRFVRMDENTGPAGALAVGLREAVAAGHDWVWLFNDDDVPHPTALESMLDAVDDLPGDTGVVGCARGDVDGRPIGLGARWRHRHVAAQGADPEGAPVPLDLVSMSCTLVSAPLVRAIGLPHVGYFMMFEDAEYSLRARRAGWGVYALPKVLAMSRNMGSPSRQSPPWRGYYQTRNHLAMALGHRSLPEVGWWAVRTAKLCAGAVRQRDRTAERVRLRALGAWHGVRGVDGRVVDPPAPVDVARAQSDPRAGSAGGADRPRRPRGSSLD
jgi:GT2 family glycosyltransferase